MNGHRETVAVMDEKGKWRNVPKGSDDFPIMRKMRITPEMALEIYCDRNHDTSENKHNRGIKQQQVVKMTEDIKRGQFTAFGPDAISFDPEGFLTNGQHRCSAVFEAGTPIDVWVMFGHDRDHIGNIDVGVKRSNKDRSIITNLGFPSEMMSACNRFCELRKVKGQMTQNQLDSLYMSCKEAAVWVNKKINKQSKGCKRSSVKAALIRLYFHFDKPVMERFINVLNEQIPDEELGLRADDPAFRFIKWLDGHITKKGAGGQGSGPKDEIYLRCLYAFEQFVAEQPVKAMSSTNWIHGIYLMEVDGRYPIPDESSLFPPKAFLKHSFGKGKVTKKK